MCWCTPAIRTPRCGRPGCHPLSPRCSVQLLLDLGALPTHTQPIPFHGDPVLSAAVRDARDAATPLSFS